MPVARARAAACCWVASRRTLMASRAPWRGGNWEKWGIVRSPKMKEKARNYALRGDAKIGREVFMVETSKNFHTGHKLEGEPIVGTAAVA